jgi:hypothetical protein
MGPESSENRDLKVRKKGNWSFAGKRTEGYEKRELKFMKKGNWSLWTKRTESYEERDLNVMSKENWMWFTIVDDKVRGWYENVDIVKLYKLIHQQSDKINVFEVQECTWKYYFPNIALRYHTVYRRVCGNGLLKYITIHATWCDNF